jgi:hypothetical protein
MRRFILAFSLTAVCAGWAQSSYHEVASVKQLMAAYQQSEDLISIGAYRKGANRAVDTAIVTILFDDQPAGAVDRNYNKDNASDTVPPFMEFPGANSDALICGLLPMTIVTAIVSPKARPKPRMSEPMMPVRA